MSEPLHTMPWNEDEFIRVGPFRLIYEFPKGKRSTDVLVLLPGGSVRWLDELLLRRVDVVLPLRWRKD